MATLNFSDDELRCKCGCGKLNPNPLFPKFMDKVQRLRTLYGKPLEVSSAYRCLDHPVELKKKKAGMHSIAAIDLRVDKEDAYAVLELAFKLGFKGIGVQQKGSPNERFIHIDDRADVALWSY